jgi:hypothetical protein
MKQLDVVSKKIDYNRDKIQVLCYMAVLQVILKCNKYTKKKIGLCNSVRWKTLRLSLEIGNWAANYVIRCKSSDHP